MSITLLVFKKLTKKCICLVIKKTMKSLYHRKTLQRYFKLSNELINVKKLSICDASQLLSHKPIYNMIILLHEVQRR